MRANPRLDKISAIANAELVCYRFQTGGRRSISGAVQKAVLWTIWAFEGERLSYEAIAARAGTSMGSAYRATQALVACGAIVVTASNGRTPRGGLTGRIFRVSTERLQELRSRTNIRRWVA